MPNGTRGGCGAGDGSGRAEGGWRIRWVDDGEAGDDGGERDAECHDHNNQLKQVAAFIPSPLR